MLQHSLWHRCKQNLPSFSKCDSLEDSDEEKGPIGSQSENGEIPENDDCPSVYDDIEAFKQIPTKGQDMLFIYQVFDKHWSKAYWKVFGKVLIFCRLNPLLMYANINLLSPQMMRLYEQYGNDMVLLDATYRTCKYALPLFFLCVRTNVNYQVNDLA